MELDIELISDKSAPSTLLLSVGYGNAHVVSQISGIDVIDDVLKFVVAERPKSGAHWIQIGSFASCPVTLFLNNDTLAIIIDSDIQVGGFGQSAGLSIPRELLDDFVAALAETRQRFVGGTQDA